MQTVLRLMFPVWLMLLAIDSGCHSHAPERVVTHPATTGEEPWPVATPSQPEFLDPDHAPVGEGWIALFDGKDLSGWHIRDPNAKSSWSVEEGILHNTSNLEQHSGVDLVSDRKFWNFEAYYEYRVPAGSNSGFYLRGRYEIQIFDSFGKPPGADQNGAIYGLKAPAKNTSRPPNEWQSVYVRIVDKKVTVVLNGEKVIDGFEVDHATGLELDQNYGQPGPILLQGNHGSVDFRYIYVREQPAQ